MGVNHGTPDCEGSSTQINKADSERTVTCTLNGLPNWPINEQIQKQKREGKPKDRAGYTQVQEDTRLGCPTKIWATTYSKNQEERLGIIGPIPIVSKETSAGSGFDGSGQRVGWKGGKVALNPNDAEKRGRDCGVDSYEEENSAREGLGHEITGDVDQRGWTTCGGEGRIQTEEVKAVDDDGSTVAGEEELRAGGVELATDGVTVDQNVGGGSWEEDKDGVDDGRATTLEGYVPEGHGNLDITGAMRDYEINRDACRQKDLETEGSSR
ncbi:hypothetical protein S83_052691 [Arachis hypogaea]